jgi:hypothetical protein
MSLSLQPALWKDCNQSFFLLAIINETLTRKGA